MPHQPRRTPHTTIDHPLDASPETPNTGATVPPRTPDALHAWLRTNLEINLRRTPHLPAHAAPFDYLCHAFFEGRDGWDLDRGEEIGAADCVVWACRGGGKTFLGALATALDLYFKPGIQVRILAGSLEQAGRMHAHLATLFEHPILASTLAGRITERRIRTRDGSMAELLAASQASVRGTRVQKIRCDEVELFDARIWEAAQLATRSAVINGRPVRAAIECFSTMHLPHGMMSRLVEEAAAGKRRLFKWGLTDILARCPEARPCHPDIPEVIERDDSGAVIRVITPAGAGDCPLWAECQRGAKGFDEAGHLSIDDAIAMKSRVGEPVWAAEMLCIRPSRALSVYPEFDPRIHTFDALPWDPAAPGISWAAGVDFGYREPTVILWAATDPRGTLWIVDERTKNQTTLSEHLEAIRAAPWPIPGWFAVDVAGAQQDFHTGQSSIQIMKDAGYTVRAFHSDILTGVGRVRARLRPALGPPRLMVQRRCRGLIEALEKYHYSDDPRDTKPVKDGPDHACDALRYLVMALEREGKTAVGRYLPE